MIHLHAMLSYSLTFGARRTRGAVAFCVATEWVRGATAAAAACASSTLLIAGGDVPMAGMGGAASSGTFFAADTVRGADAAAATTFSVGVGAVSDTDTASLLGDGVCG